MKIKRIPAIILAATMLGTMPIVSPETGLSLSTVAYAAEKLNAPKDFTAAVNGTAAVLSWSAVKGADAYRIYQYDRSAKKFVNLKTVTSTKTSVKGLAEGKNYFKVAALTKSGSKYITGNISEKITVTVASAAESSAKTSGKNSAAVALAKKMGDGWNLGNTMESVATWLGADATPKDYEKAWGQPETTAAMIKSLKASGFESVRVPVAWSNMMSKDGKYTISPEYFDRIDEIVGYILDNDMYCIINIHWDGGWWEDFGSSDEKVAQAAMDKYTAMWKQIAKHYKSYSDKLIFESANEELGSKTKGSSSMNESYERVNNINQKFVDIVRSTGGKNKSRFLLIAGYDTDISKTADNRFKMPDDTAKDRLLVSVHYYSPSTFCIADKKSNSWGYSDSWGTEDDYNTMRRDFEKMRKFTDAGYGVIIGEYGVCHNTDGGKHVMKKGTDKFLRSVNDLSSEMGYCAMIWDCSDWFNRKTQSYNYDFLKDIYD